MRRAAIPALAAAIALVATACGGDEEPGSSGALTVRLSAQNGSGESGTATLTANGDSATRVVVDLENGPSAPQPAHVHPGTCDDLDPAPKYTLSNVVGGKSETTIRVPLADLKRVAYAINVHKSVAEVQTYVACGAIGGEGTGSDSGGRYGY